MALPALRLYKSLNPDKKIYLAVRKNLVSLFYNIKEIDKVIGIDDSFFKLFKAKEFINKDRIEEVILFTNSFKSALFFYFAGIRNISGYNKDSRKILLKNFIDVEQNNKKFFYYYIDLIKKLHPNKDYNFNPDFSLSILKKEEQSLSDKLKEIVKGDKFISVAPMAAYGPAKAWLPDNYAKLINLFCEERERDDIKIILLGSLAERDKIDYIAKQTLPNRVYNIAGLFSLRESIITIKKSLAFIGNDSGLMHCAYALNTPLISIFGPTDPAKTFPEGRNSILFYKRKNCSPCSYRICPKKEHYCMISIEPKDVLQSLYSLI